MEPLIWSGLSNRLAVLTSCVCLSHEQKCGDTGAELIGLPRLRPLKFMSISKRQKTVSRAYGGTLCGKAVRERIVRAFLVEEKKYALKLQKKAA